MPPLPKKKHSKARKGGRTSHFGLRATSLAECPQCHSARLPHRVCQNCGYYNGGQVIAAATTESEQ